MGQRIHLKDLTGGGEGGCGMDTYSLGHQEVWTCPPHTHLQLLPVVCLGCVRCRPLPVHSPRGLHSMMSVMLWTACCRRVSQPFPTLCVSPRLIRCWEMGHAPPAQAPTFSLCRALSYSMRASILSAPGIHTLCPSSLSPPPGPNAESAPTPCEPWSRTACSPLSPVRLSPAHPL